VEVNLALVPFCVYFASRNSACAKVVSFCTGFNINKGGLNTPGRLRERGREPVTKEVRAGGIWWKTYLVAKVLSHCSQPKKNRCVESGERKSQTILFASRFNIHPPVPACKMSFHNFSFQAARLHHHIALFLRLLKRLLCVG